MIHSGDHVSYLNGNTEYVATRTNTGWVEREFTLTSVKTGRRRYKILESQLTHWDQRIPVKAVKTSLGRVRRPANWKQLDNFAGGARRTYIGDQWVFKKGHSSWGESRCQVEACRYFVQSGGTIEEAVTKFGPKIAKEVDYYKDVPVAECYLLADGTLLMERVTPVASLQRGDGAPTMEPEERERRGLTYEGSAWPRWAGKVDSAQIGLNRHGELVAYDL